MNKNIPVNTPLFKGNEKKYLNECIETGWISSEGPFVEKFEQKFSRSVNRKYGIAVCNGSAALELAVVALGIGKGDEVIMPTFTIISCASAVVRAGAKPVLVDNDPNTWTMDVTKVEEKITKKTKAIMVVHIYGLPVDMDPIITLAKQYNLKIIEDSAEAHGLAYKNRPCGSFGDISIFSFYPNKLVTTGEGGMVVTDSDKLAKKCKSLRNLCFLPHRRFFHEELGWNMRMTNLQAALGLAQLEKLEEFIIRKRKMGRIYQQEFKGLKSIQLPLPSVSYANNIYWVFGMVLREDIPFDALHIMNLLSKERIGTRPFFWPMHEQPVFLKMGLFKNERYPVSEKLGRKGFYIPSGLGLEEGDMKKVGKALRKVLKA